MYQFSAVYICGRCTHVPNKLKKFFKPGNQSSRAGTALLVSWGPNFKALIIKPLKRAKNLI